jgi:hypothetical protein
MKSIICICLLSICSLLCFGEIITDKYKNREIRFYDSDYELFINTYKLSKNDFYEFVDTVNQAIGGQYAEYLKDSTPYLNQGMRAFIDVYTFIYEKGKRQESIDALNLLLKYFKGKWITVSEYSFTNIMYDIIDNNDEDYFNYLKKVDASLLTCGITTWNGISSETCLDHCVYTDNVKWAEVYLKMGYSPNSIKESDGMTNIIKPLFSETQSEEMRKLLLKYGAKTEIVYTLANVGHGSVNSYCTDDNVRIRDKPNTNSNILGKLSKGNKFEITGQSTDEYKLENDEYFWYKINYNGIAGWVYGKYVYIYGVTAEIY